MFLKRSLKPCFDEVEETNGDEEFHVWVKLVLGLKPELALFVASRREGGGGTAEYEGFAKGAFNVTFRFSFNDGAPDVIIRFPKPGHTATVYRDEKVANEVQVMECLRENTDIPIPRIHSWGLTAEGPHGLGPFIIMDVVDGVLLSSILNHPDKKGIGFLLNPDLDMSILDKVYHQIARYMIQLSQLTFSRIGAISKDDATGTWSVTGRPLTYNMNELRAVTNYPEGQFPTAPFDRASDYFRSVANVHLTHVWTQRNIAYDPEEAQLRFIARHRMAQLIPKYCADDSGPFTPFCDDMRPSNMLVDPETLRITGVIDWEFTNAMPAQFSYDPPWWLLLTGPESWLDRYAMEEFLILYEPRLEQFLRALEHVETEAALEGKQASGPPLSSRMRESWKTRQFWFDYAVRNSFEGDSVYWAALHEGGPGIELLDDKARAELEPFTQKKMEQLKVYREDCRVRYETK
ncbi:phosphotransferase enzyme family protein-like protein [Aspergillus californicus]